MWPTRPLPRNTMRGTTSAKVPKSWNAGADLATKGQVATPVLNGLGRRMHSEEYKMDVRYTGAHLDRLQRVAPPRETNKRADNE